jgi:hypothetical protein
MAKYTEYQSCTWSFSNSGAKNKWLVWYGSVYRLSMQQTSGFNLFSRKVLATIILFL